MVESISLQVATSQRRALEHLKYVTKVQYGQNLETLSVWHRRLGADTMMQNLVQRLTACWVKKTSRL